MTTPSLPPREIPELDLREALDSLPSGILISDTQGVIVYCNETQSQLDGLPRERIIGRHITELYIPSPVSSPILTVIRTGQPIFARTLSSTFSPASIPTPRLPDSEVRLALS